MSDTKLRESECEAPHVVGLTVSMSLSVSASPVAFAERMRVVRNLDRGPHVPKPMAVGEHRFLRCLCLRAEEAARLHGPLESRCARGPASAPVDRIRGLHSGSACV